jgi:putative flippase GtrA
MLRNGDLVVPVVRAARTQFVRFCFVGVIGFCIDVVVLLSLVDLLGVGPYVGRVFSYLVAATGTWSLNRHFTFPPSGSDRWHHEWARYVIVNAVGAGVNYGAYAFCVWSSSLVQQYLILGVAVGSAFGLAVNFTASRYLVFRPS